MDLRVPGRAGLCAPALVVLLGCASTGAESHDSLRADADRAGIVEPRQQADDDRALRGPGLERDAAVRAVLHRNPSIAAAPQGWRAPRPPSRRPGATAD